MMADGELFESLTSNLQTDANMAQDRTFVIVAHKDIKADGVHVKAGDKVAMITGVVSPHTLLGLMQFHGFKAEEVNVDEALANHTDDEAPDAEPQASDAADADVDTGAADIDASYPPTDSEPESASEGDAPAQPASPVEQAVAAFVADGLDEKTARALAETNKLTPDGVRKLVADGKDLLDLEGVGVTRAEKIKAAYSAQ